MKFTPIPLVLPSVLDDADSDRNPGLHISDVIKHLLMQIDPKKYGKPEEADTRILWELGLAWEVVALSRAFWKRILKRTFPKISFKQVQLLCDGIWGTCDMISLDAENPFGFGPDVDVITESKLTRYSMAHHPQHSINFWGWRVQIMAYCYMWGIRHALLPVCFLNGDYKPKQIVPRAWAIKFKQSELVENWNMILQARDEILAAQKATKRSKKKNG